MLKDILRQLGFSDNEIAVYLSVLEYGRLSYTNLSKKTGLNRTTTYSASRELLNRGLLQEDLSSPVKALVAAPPEALSDLTAREEAALNEHKALVEQAVGELRSLPTVSGYVAPAITFIPQERIQRHFRERNDDWNASLLKTDQTWWGFNDIAFMEQYSAGWLPWYWEHAPKGIRVKNFSNDKGVERELQKTLPTEREIRFWRGDHVFTGCLWIIGEYVVTVNVRQSPHYLVEMRDPVLAHNLRTVFATLWEATNLSK